MTASPFVFDTTEADFEQAVLQASTEVPVLVDFWAPWCGPCKQLGPVLEKLVDGYQGRVLLAKLNTDEQMQLAALFGIRSLPTVMLLKGGRPIDGFMGVQPESAIRAMLEPHLGPAPEPDIDAEPQPPTPAEQLAQARALVAGEPDKDEHRLPLITALLANGLSEEAALELERLPANLAQSDAAKKARAQLSFAAVLAGAPGAASLQATIGIDPADLKARHQFGTRLLFEGDSEAALEQFLEIMRRDRKFEDDLGRKTLIAAFELIDDADLVSRTRKRMAAMLF